jgi:hypothetical protein
MVAVSSGAVTLGTQKIARLLSPGVGLRSIALSGPGSGWGVSDTGDLLHLAEGRWSGAGGASLTALSRLTQALGGAPLSGSPAASSTGLNALSLTSSGLGYAVGAQGIILRYANGAWASDASPTTATLTAVASAGDRAVAVGSQGTLLERSASGWQASAEATRLVGGQDFTGVVALPDGTFVAAAGDSIIARQPDQTEWAAAPLAPLGQAPTRLAAYRDSTGALHVVALLGAPGQQALLDGDAAGWRQLALPAGVAVSDLEVDQQSRLAWVAGELAGRPVTTALALPEDSILTQLVDAAGLAPGLAAPAASPAAGTAGTPAVVAPSGAQLKLNGAAAPGAAAAGGAVAALRSAGL